MKYEKYEHLCEIFGESTYHVCKETGVNPVTISNWKNGKYTPKYEVIEKLSSYFHVSSDYFLDRNEYKKDETMIKYEKLDEESKELINKLIDKLTK